MPGTFPMIDPNVVNYMSFNQPFAGYPPSDFMAQNGQPPQPPAPQQYQHFGFSDYNNNNNNVHGKKSYAKHRRSGSKHDNFKSRNSDGHSPKKPQLSSSSNNLNSLDITPAPIELLDGGTGEYVSPVDINFTQPTIQQALESSTAAELENSIVETSAKTPTEILTDASISGEKLDTDHVHDETSNPEVSCDLKHDASHRFNCCRSRNFRSY